MTDKQIDEGLWLCRNATDDPRRAEAAVAFHAKKYYATALAELQARRATDAGQPAVTALRERCRDLLAKWAATARAEANPPEGQSERDATFQECCADLEAALDAAAPPAPMTLEQAVGVLNERRHRGGGWFFPTQDAKFVIGKSDYDRFDAFEACAIAEKYLRDGTGEAQEVGDGE